MMKTAPMSEEGPTFSEEPVIGGSKAGRRRTGCPSLSLDAIMEGSSDHALPKPSKEVHAKFRGYVDSETPTRDAEDMLKNLPPAAVRLMSYNILAARYVTTDKYRHCPTWALAEPYRASNVVAEIGEARPDIIFFQELSSDLHRAEYFGGRLRSKPFGYDSFHLPISDKTGKSHAMVSSGNGVASSIGSSGSYTNDNSETANRVAARRSANSGAAAANSSEVDASGGIPISEDVSRPEFEGVAIFFNAQRFEVMEHLPVKFNHIASRDEKLTVAEKSRVSIKSHNVGIVSVLKDRRLNEFYICACTHGFYDWTKPECQLWQAIRLLKEIEELESTYSAIGLRVHVVIGADLNCDRNSAAVRYILEGKVPSALNHGTAATNGPPAFERYRDATHSLQLQSTYDTYSQAFPNHVTTTNPTYSGVIDFILVSRTLDVLAVARLDQSHEIPTHEIPSDHFPIAAVVLPGAA